MLSAEAPPQHEAERRAKGPLPPSESMSGHCMSSSLQGGQLQRLQSIFPERDLMQLAESELRTFRDRAHCLPRIGGWETPRRSLCSLFTRVWPLIVTSSHMAVSLPDIQALQVTGKVTGQGLGGSRALCGSWERQGVAPPITAQGTVVSTAALWLWRRGPAGAHSDPFLLRQVGRRLPSPLQGRWQHIRWEASASALVLQAHEGPRLHRVIGEQLDGLPGSGLRGSCCSPGKVLARSQAGSVRACPGLEQSTGDRSAACSGRTLGAARHCQEALLVPMPRGHSTPVPGAFSCPATCQPSLRTKPQVPAGPSARPAQGLVLPAACNRCRWGQAPRTGKPQAAAAGASSSYRARLDPTHIRTPTH